ncbi:MAG: hypothetical protein AAGC66_04520 [Leifsonia sp.]
MATFSVINMQQRKVADIEAALYRYDDKFVTFYDSSEVPVYSVAQSLVYTIERKQS